MKPHRWLHEHSLKLLAIRDTPEAIAGGIAIGIFFGFTPLFGLKTLSAIFFAWLSRSNIIAAVIAASLHDVLLPFMPFIYRFEYDLGYVLLYHEWPQRLIRATWRPHGWRNWTTFLSVGKPWLLGSVVCGAPVALISFFVSRAIVSRHQRKTHPGGQAQSGAGSSTPP